MAQITIPISGIIANFELESESNVTPKTLKKSLDAAKGKDITVTINTPGGSVFPGLEMFSLLQNYPGNVETRIVSLAASMGSVLALAGDEKTAENTALYFIHNAQGIGFGDHRDLLKESEFLKDISILIANLYAEFTSLSLKEARDFMDDDSHFFGNDLELLGFDIIQTGNDANASIARVNAKQRFQEVKNKISEEDYMQDLEKAVACIDYEKFGINTTDTQNNRSFLDEISDFKNLGHGTTIKANAMENYGIENTITLQNNATTPASAGKNKTEVNMTLKEFLNSDPAANAEFKEAITKAKTAGAEGVNKRVEQASEFLKADSTYPDSIKNLAVDTVTGKVGIESLNAAVAAFDAMKEAMKSEAAQGESDTQGETPAGGGELPSTDGTIKNEIDFAASVVEDRKKAGLEVN